MVKWFGVWIFAFLAIANLARAQATIPEAEALYLPTPQRLSAVCAAGQRDGWGPQTAMLRAAAVLAYEREKFAAAEAWLNVYRWATLFAQPESEFVPAWGQAVNAAGVGHVNMPSRYDAPPRPLGLRLTPELQAWLVGNTAYSAEFFTLLTPVDFLPRVFEILNVLYFRDPARFKTYANLALALAVVYDVPPPPVWPHRQVTEASLPRKFPDPIEAFGWWVKQDQQGKTYQKLTRLGAGELKFVVDTVTPFPELEWSQTVADYPLSHLDKAYSMIRYRNDRIVNGAPVWPSGAYKMAQILAQGGICPDQAYFAAEVGKARGVPTLIILGAGKDGRHAWFGYLDSGQKWKLDAGRYADQRFVTGFAVDPQTWREFSDHELQFLSERFRELPSFAQSRAHEQFAALYLASGKAAAASAAARKAVSFERRNQAAWDTLIAAARKEGRDAKAIETLLREAALAFQLYPDLEAYYVNRVAESLRARGETSAADAEVRRIANKNRSQRGDLSVQQARDIVQRAIATQPLAEQIRTYNTTLDNYGRGAGVSFFDQVVVPFADHLVQLKQKPEALKAIERAKRTLKIEPNSQLAQDLECFTAAVKTAK